jgi:hypothetical protein
MPETIQAIGMANDEEAARGQHAVEASNQLGLGFLLKIDQHITAEDKVKGLGQRVASLKEIDVLKSHMFKNLRLNPALPLIGSAAPFEIASQPLGIG